MAGKVGKARQGGFADRIRALLAETADLTTEELERRAKALNVLARAESTLADLAESGARAEFEQAYIDPAGERDMRERLLRRMVALEAEILAEEAAGAADR